MSSFDIVHIPESCKSEVDSEFQHFSAKFSDFGEVKASEAPHVAVFIYHRAQGAYFEALSCIIDHADFTQYTLCVGQFIGYVCLLEEILRR